MRLNQSHKQMVITAIMEDVPKVDYNEQFRTLVMSYWKRYAMPEVKALVEKGHADQLCDQYWSSNRPSGSVCTQGYVVLSSEDQAAFREARDKINKQRDEQDKSRRVLRARISATVNSCSTLKQLKDRLPEFEKYFPKDQPAPTPNLPVANLIADLQAAGWPKAQKK